MDNFMIYETESILRAFTPLQAFLEDMRVIINEILIWIKNPTRGIIPVLFMNEPLLLLPIGFVAMTATVGILKRMLSRD